MLSLGVFGTHMFYFGLFFFFSFRDLSLMKISLKPCVVIPAVHGVKVKKKVTKKSLSLIDTAFIN